MATKPWAGKLRATLRYARYRLRDVWTEAARLILHLILVVCGLVAIWIPTKHQDVFSLASPSEYFVFGFVDNNVHLNWPAIWLSVALLVGVGDYFATNIKRVFEPRARDLAALLERLALTHAEIALQAAQVSRLAEGGLATPGELEAALIKMLANIDSLVAKHVDTISKTDVVTSNVMLMFDPADIDGRKWRHREPELLRQRIYAEDGCDSGCRAWLLLEVQSPASSKQMSLTPLTIRVHPTPKLSAPGAGVAVHGGIATARGVAPPVLEGINDVTRIEFAPELPASARAAAEAHFKAIKLVNSFISVPLVHGDAVVGVLNVNSSGFYLAGWTEQQRATVQAVLLPAVAPLAEVGYHLRRSKYEV